MPLVYAFLLIGCAAPALNGASRGERAQRAEPYGGRQSPDDFRAEGEQEIALLFEQGRHAEAEEALERALAMVPDRSLADDPRIVTLANTLADLYATSGRQDKAQALRERLLAAKGKSPASGGALRPAGSDVFAWLQLTLLEVKLLSVEQKYAQAEQKAKEALEKLRAAAPEDTPGMPFRSVLWSLTGHLAMFLVEQGKHAEAEQVLEGALAMVADESLADDAHIIGLASALAALYTNYGKQDKARALQKRLLAAAKGKSVATVSSPEGGDLSAWAQLTLTEVRLLFNEKNYAEAEEKAKEALEKVRAAGLDDTPGIAFHSALWSLTSHLVISLFAQDKYAEAEEKIKEALGKLQGERLRDRAGIAFPAALWGMTSHLAMTLIAQGKESEAERMLEQALADTPTENFANLHVSRNMRMLVDLYLRSGKQDKAHALYAKLVAAKAQHWSGLSFPADRDPLAFGAEARVLMSHEKYAEAEAMLQQGMRQAELEQQTPLDLKALLAECYRAQGKTKEAKAAYQEWVSLVEKRVASGQLAPRAGQIYQSYADFLKEIGETEEAKKYAEKARSVRSGR